MGILWQTTVGGNDVYTVTDIGSLPVSATAGDRAIIATIPPAYCIYTGAGWTAALDANSPGGGAVDAAGSAFMRSDYIWGVAGASAIPGIDANISPWMTITILGDPYFPNANTVTYLQHDAVLNLVPATPPVFGAAGPAHASGDVPDPGTTPGTARYLREDGTWVAPVGSGTVSSVGLALPADLTVSGSPVIGAGTLTAVWANEAANLVHAGPSSGGAAVPTWRLLTGADLPVFLAGAPHAQGAVPDPGAGGGTVKFLREDATWQVPGGGSGTVTSVGLALPAELTVSGTPVTVSGTLTGVWASQTAGKVFAAPAGGPGTPAFRVLASTDIPALAYVTSVALSLGGGVFTVSGSPVTSSGTLTGTLATQTANFVFAGPTSGGAVAPTFRALVATDVPALAYVTSVALTLPADLAVTGSPITSTGTFAVTRVNQNANVFLGGPTSGGAATPGYRLLVAADIPAIPESGVTNLVADLSTLTTAVGLRALASRLINTNAPLTGGGDLSADRTLAVSDFIASGAGHARGTVPDPGAVADSSRFLRGDATWAPPAVSTQPQADQDFAGNTTTVLWSDPLVPAAGVAAILEAGAVIVLDPRDGREAFLQTSPEPTSDVPLYSGSYASVRDFPLVLDAGRLLSLDPGALLEVKPAEIAGPFVPTGTAHAMGAVPDPGAIPAGKSGRTRYLREDQWAEPARWFNPAQPPYNAKFDSRTITDAAITGGTNLLNSPAQAQFSANLSTDPLNPGDVGRQVVVANAGAGGTDLYATITGWNSATQVVVAPAAGNTVSAAGANIATDDTLAIRACIADVVLYHGGLDMPHGIALVSDKVAGLTGVYHYLYVTGSPTGGTFTLTVPGAGTTAAIAFSVTPATTGANILAALNALTPSSVFAIETGARTDIFRIIFNAAKGNLTANTAGLTGGTTPAMYVRQPVIQVANTCGFRWIARAAGGAARLMTDWTSGVVNPAAFYANRTCLIWGGQLNGIMSNLHGTQDFVFESHGYIGRACQGAVEIAGIIFLHCNQFNVGCMEGSIRDCFFTDGVTAVQNAMLTTDNTCSDTSYHHVVFNNMVNGHVTKNVQGVDVYFNHVSAYSISGSVVNFEQGGNWQWWSGFCQNCATILKLGAATSNGLNLLGGGVNCSIFSMHGVRMEHISTATCLLDATWVQPGCKIIIEGFSDTVSYALPATTNTSGIANPTTGTPYTAPTLAAAGGGTLPAGTYYVSTSQYVALVGETLPSPEASITLTGLAGSNAISITAQALRGAASGTYFYVTAAGSRQGQGVWAGQSAAGVTFTHLASAALTPLIILGINANVVFRNSTVQEMQEICTGDGNATNHAFLTMDGIVTANRRVALGSCWNVGPNTFIQSVNDAGSFYNVPRPMVTNVPGQPNFSKLNTAIMLRNPKRFFRLGDITTNNFSDLGWFSQNAANPYLPQINYILQSSTYATNIQGVIRSDGLGAFDTKNGTFLSLGTTSDACGLDLSPFFTFYATAKRPTTTVATKDQHFISNYRTGAGGWELKIAATTNAVNFLHDSGAGVLTTISTNPGWPQGMFIPGDRYPVSVMISRDEIAKTLSLYAYAPPQPVPLVNTSTGTPSVMAALAATAITVATTTTGGNLSNGTYLVRQTQYNALGETLPGTELTVTLAGGTATQTFTVTGLALVANATGSRFYVGTTAGAGTLAAQPNNTSSSGIVSGAFGANFSNVTISAMTFVAAVITATVPTTVGLTIGTPITISGVTGFATNNPNGQFVVQTVPSGTTFTYVASATPTGAYTANSGRMAASLVPGVNWSPTVLPAPSATPNVQQTAIAAFGLLGNMNTGVGAGNVYAASINKTWLFGRENVGVSAELQGAAWVLWENALVGADFVNFWNAGNL